MITFKPVKKEEIMQRYQGIRHDGELRAIIELFRVVDEDAIELFCESNEYGNIDNLRRSVQWTLAAMHENNIQCILRGSQVYLIKEVK